MVELFYTTYISVYLAHYEIFRAKVGKGGINACNMIMPHRQKPCLRGLWPNKAQSRLLSYGDLLDSWLFHCSMFR